ncbi:hypothetical protein GCM10009821_07460 [Aeromicrobium halocynthiae]|uniref:HEPN AbiJ-N-terminal domain-containing protein n=1 Tax=Aeromicrobium halocynthiae TaxID=560557 RepID=A0ABN2VTC7_9ACTN
MARFSERMGHRPVREVIQRQAVDDATRNRLWDVVWSCLPRETVSVNDKAYDRLYYAIWIGFFELPADAMPNYSDKIHARLRNRFFAGDWHEMYDILEYTIQHSGRNRHRATKFANEVLEDYLCAYRFVSGELVEVTDQQAIDAIEDALAHPLSGVRTHLRRSINLLADRANPDAANSVKEAVSAVEALCIALVGQKATLGDALKKLEAADILLHPAVKKAWLALYGWTSDAHGIRHAMQDESEVPIEDAVYMLVSCSAFVTLLTEKARKAGIELTAIP